MKKSKRFDDDAYIRNFETNGKFPAIHEDISHIISKYASEKEPCIDIGACTSLLSIQAVCLGRSLCVSVEGNRAFYEKAVKYPNVFQYRLLITKTHLSKLEDLIIEYKPTLLIARRILPELADRGIELVQEVAKILFQNNVQKIVLEGRKPTKNATNILPNADKEVEALSDFYKLKHAYKQVRLLEKL